LITRFSVQKRTIVSLSVKSPKVHSISFWALFPKKRKMSSRPLRSTRIKAVAPVLPEIISRINLLDGLFYESIRNEVEAVTKYFKDDADIIAEFWLSHYEYNLIDFKHLYLLSMVFSITGLKQELVVGFLDKIIDESIVHKLGAVRVNNGKKVFYRMRVGDRTDL
jgi:hypothetical protein